MNIDSLADSVFLAVKDYCARDFDARMVKVLEEIERRLAALPVPKDGKDGEPGINGKDGESIKGDSGEAGKDGEPGAPGLPGKDGINGKDGASGAPGKDGEKGADGKDGLSIKGDPGVNGKDADPAVILEMVQRAVSLIPKALDGAPGTDGTNGRDGLNGQNGEPGRDALQIDPLPSIDETRTYARGTYASHLGGLWRAKAVTVGMEGWECVVNGLASIEVIDHDDGRTTTEKHIMSDGRVFPIVRKSRVPIYRKVFREGQTYEPGDMVTRDGGVWHCNEPTTEIPIEGCKDWTLSTKRGRDGKDGLRGEKGERGSEGRKGTDLTQMLPNGSKF